MEMVALAEEDFAEAMHCRASCCLAGKPCLADKPANAKRESIPDITGSLLAYNDVLHECVIQIPEWFEMMQQKETTNHDFEGNQQQFLSGKCSEVKGC
jgi:hypothetical protein